VQIWGPRHCGGLVSGGGVALWGGMPRYALKIEYDGVPFAGWQRQNNHPSVQGAIEAALAKIQPGEHNIAAAGRTDAGVHATAQVAHVDLIRDWDPFRLAGAINHHLKPAPIAIVDLARVDDDFHARFSARERRYFFRLVCRRAPVVHDRGKVWQVLAPVDVEAMRAGAAHLIGHHDFTTFRSSLCQAKSPMKTMDEIRIETVATTQGQEINFHLRARSFLHNQVRSIVGTLERVGSGGWAPERVGEALAARDRAACGPVCPPQGLYLSGVGYPEDPFAPVA
jgi:tRNA pseudouridine38-40 synthase